MRLIDEVIRMSKKKITGYAYHNGMWYEMYKNHPRQPVSEEYVIKHYKNYCPNCGADMRKEVKKNDYTKT